MSESAQKPTFSAHDLQEIIPRFARKISSGAYSDLERTRPEDDDADILALIDHAGDAAFTVVRLRDRYAAYDQFGGALGEATTVAELLEQEAVSSALGADAGTLGTA